MAEKEIFMTDHRNYYGERLVQYQYFGGFALSQKQKCIESLHKEIQKLYPGKRVLEISTKSTNPLGVQLSAFNLMFYHEELKEQRHIENVFQSSKVFEHGGPYTDLLNVEPKDAKRDPRLQESGRLSAFRLYGEDWPLEPKTMFYDWLYISALKENKALAEAITEYDIFTDIEFNYKKSINCQARAAAIFVSLCRAGQLEEKTSGVAAFRTIYPKKR